MKIIWSFSQVCEKFSLGFFEYSDISTHPPPTNNKCQVPKNHKRHGRYENFECNPEKHYTGAVIKILLTFGGTPGYTRLLWAKMIKSEKPPAPGVAMLFEKVMKK